MAKKFYNFLTIIFILLSGTSAVTQIDYYYLLCSDLITTNRAYNCLASGNNAPNYTCQCTSINFARSLFDCINGSSTLAGVKNGLKVSWDAYNSTCGSNVGLQVPPMIDIASSIKENPINQSFYQANYTGSGDFYTPASIIVAGNIHKAGKAYYKQSYSCIHWGQGLLGYIFGIITIQIMLNAMSWLLPSIVRSLGNCRLGRIIRRYITMPAMFDEEHTEPFMVMRSWPLMFPQRLHTILILGLYGLVIAFLAAEFKVELSPYGFGRKSVYITYWLALRCAWYTMYMLVPAFLFAGRNNFLITLTGWQFSTFLIWHKHIARLCTLLIIIHASSSTVKLLQQHSYSIQWKFHYFVMGFVAIMSMSIACIQAVKFLRAYSYDFFVHVHFALAVVTCACIWEHLKAFKVCYQMLYAMIAVWGFDRLCRIIKILINRPGTLCDAKDYGDVIVLKIKYGCFWRPVAGSYVFIHFLHPYKFTQSHPFTALYGTDEECDINNTLEKGKSNLYYSTNISRETSSGDGKGYLKLFVRKQKGITKMIGSRKNWKVMIDGPYGTQFNTHPYSELIFVAGGIGITGVYSHLKHAIENRTERLTSVSLYWSVRDLGCLVWFHKEIVELQSLPLVNLHIHVSEYQGEHHHKNPISKYFHSHQRSLLDDDENLVKISHWDNDESMRNTIKNTRLNIKSISIDHIENSKGPICFFACGPGTMCDDVRKHVTQNFHKTSNYVNYQEEAFAF